MTGGPGSRHALRFVLSRSQSRAVPHWWRGMQTSGQSRQLTRTIAKIESLRVQSPQNDFFFTAMRRIAILSINFGVQS